MCKYLYNMLGWRFGADPSGRPSGAPKRIPSRTPSATCRLLGCTGAQLGSSLAQLSALSCHLEPLGACPTDSKRNLAPLGLNLGLQAALQVQLGTSWVDFWCSCNTQNRALASTRAQFSWFRHFCSSSALGLLFRSSADGFERLLDSTWRLLGVSWGALGRSSAGLGRSWRALGRSWEALGHSSAPFGGSWASLGLSLIHISEPTRRS